MRPSSLTPLGLPPGDRVAVLRLPAIYQFPEMAEEGGFDCRDISRWDVQCEIAESLGVDIGAIEERIHSGIAFARLAADYQDADKMRIEGSPSFVLNEGRQKLYGNVGFHLMDANIQELFRTPHADEASWC
jgi:predicted DsbA family dithiol-disulfide isomerase